MFIQTEQTPNPATMKFLPGCQVMENGTREFASKEAAQESPLAARLFESEGVEKVFFGADFIAVSKNDGYDWPILRPIVVGAVIDHFAANTPLFHTEKLATSTEIDEDPIVAEIKELLNTRIRPAVAMDGGDIVFDKFEAGVLYVQLQGACSGCPSSSLTLKDGIENMLRHYVPEVQEVRAVGV